MAQICDSIIAQGIGTSCEDMVQRGLEADGIIINRKDIDFSATTFDESVNNIVKTLVLKTGKQGYPVSQLGATPFTGTNTTLVKGTYVNKFNNTVALVVLDNGAEVCENIIDKLANGEFVVILKNKHKGAGGKGEYQIYGYYQGLYAETIDNDKYSEETEGGWAVTLLETGTPKSGVFLWNTDKETTEAQFDSLKSAE